MLDASGESFIVQASLFLGAVAILLTALFLMAALALRRLVGRRQAQRERIEWLWMPVMLQALRGEGGSVPRLRRREAVVVLGLWNRLAAGIEGEAVDRLRGFARQAGLDDEARRVMKTGSEPDRLVAAIFLGRLKDIRAVRALRSLAASPHVVVRAEAARAIVRLDPNAGPKAVVPLIADWDDCHPAVAMAVLKDASATVVAGVVAEQALAATDTRRRVRMVDLLTTIKAPAALDSARTLLSASGEPEVVSRCLEVIREHRRPEDRDRVRSFLRHPEGFVRVQAVATLGRILGRRDEWHLAAALDDRDWWVRRRAAEALVGARSVSPALVRHLASVHPDRYARDALAQAISEARGRS